MTENLNLYAKQFKNRSSALIFDGKNIVPQGAEVYLLHKEDQPKVSTVKSDIDGTLTDITNVIEKLETLSSKEIRTEDRFDFNEKC